MMNKIMKRIVLLLFSALIIPWAAVTIIVIRIKQGMPVAPIVFDIGAITATVIGVVGVAIALVLRTIEEHRAAD